MAQSVDRRGFMKASASLAAGLGIGAATGAGRADADQAPAQAPAASKAPARAPAPPVSSLNFKTRLQKALIAQPTEDDLRRIKDAGFDGVEGRVIPPEEAAKMRQVAEKIGLGIHAVLYGWAEFNSPDKSEVERTFAESQAALRTAEAFGADALLLVPCRIGARRPAGGGPPQGPAMRIPRAWEFQIEFDPKNGHLTRVVHGDNKPFADYIAAHNHATDTSTEWVKRLIPLAEKTKVVIALENVGNNLWSKPEIFRHFVQSFQSPWVKAYFDIANHERFARAEDWILTLGDLLARVHVKDYLLDPADPDGRGRGVNIREGSVRWPVVRQALEAVNYSGWMTIEGSGDLSMEERNRRLDLIVAGQ